MRGSDPRMGIAAFLGGDATGEPKFGMTGGGSGRVVTLPTPAGMYSMQNGVPSPMSSVLQSQARSSSKIASRDTYTHLVTGL
jgi:hypothetical protein